MKQLDLHVTGMTCGACERRIEKALSRVEGVAQTSADHRAARVRVLFDPSRAAESTVRSTIGRAGYTVAP